MTCEIVLKEDVDVNLNDVLNDQFYKNLSTIASMESTRKSMEACVKTLRVKLKIRRKFLIMIFQEV